jgi:hypothetical protein
MIAIFPVGALSAFPLIVFLSGTPCRQLNALGDDLSSLSVINEEMYMIGSCHVIENDNPIPFLGLKKPVDPPLAVLCEFQQELLLVATMCNVPCMTGYVMSVGSWHSPWTLWLSKTISMPKWAF